MNRTPICLWLSCFSSKARIRTRTSACISTVPAAQFALEWPFMTHCSLLNRKSPHYVWGLPPAWGLFCWRLARLKNVLRYRTRVISPNPLGGARGQASDIEIHAREILYLKERLNQLLAQ